MNLHIYIPSFLNGKCVRGPCPKQSNNDVDLLKVKQVQAVSLIGAEERVDPKI